MAIVSDTINIPTPGTRVQVTHKANIRTMVFKARPSNAGLVYIGGNDVAAAAGMTLNPGEALTCTFPEAISTSQFYVDAATASDKVDYLGA